MTLSRLILGLLAVAPMTGYDIKRHLDTTVRHFWTADKAQVYRTLTALVRDGLATVEVTPQQGRPARQDHHITAAGRAALHEWLAGPLPPPAEREPFLARLFFAGDLDRQQIRALLEQRRAQAEELLAALTAMPDPGTADRSAFVRNATLRNGLAHAQTELEWLTTVERELG